MALKISVVPIGDGWAVRSPSFENDMLFTAGGRAEVAARGLAQRYADRGETVEVAIYLRDGALAGRFLHPAAAAHLDAVPA